MKNILVTGGAGYIGSHVCVALAEAGFNPMIVDNLSNSTEDAIDGIKGITGVRPEFYHYDARDDGQLSMLSGRVHGVIHLAAYKSVGESTEHPLKYYYNNVGGLVGVLDAMRKGTPFVFSGSCTVYGTPKSVPVDETAPDDRAESPYGRTKQMCERIIRDHYGSLGPDAKGAVILRYFNPVGAHPSALIGELPIGPPNNLVPVITQVAAGIRPKLTVHGYGYPTKDGTAVRDYVHVMDVARAHVSALREAMSESGTQVYNIGTGRGMSVLEAVKEFESATGVSVPYEVGPPRPGDVAVVYADAARAKEKLGWEPTYSMRDAMLHAWRWQQRLNQLHNGN